MNYWLELQDLMNGLECDVNGDIVPYEEVNTQIVEKLIDMRRTGKRLYFAGNGGSAGIAVHMVSDFLKNGRIRTGDLYGSATMTCLANDFGYDNVFSQQLLWQMDAGDGLVAISSSGRSPNILKSVEATKKVGGYVITLSGFEKENPLRKQGDSNIYVPSSSYGMVESIHNAILQRIVDELMEI